MKKLYDVRWEDADGEMAYYVKMTGLQARKLKKYLGKMAKDGTISNVTVEPIQGDLVHTATGIKEIVKERYGA